MILAVCGALAVQARGDEETGPGKFNTLSGAGEATLKEPVPGNRPVPHIKELKVTATLKDYPQVHVSTFRGQASEKCVTCHDGIEEVSPAHPREFGCTVCHGGDGQTVDKESAHASLIYDPRAGTGKRNPSSLRVVEKTCGQGFCHSGHSQSDRNHIQRVKKSIMATLAGMISGLRYSWSGQSRRTAKYGVRSIKDEDGDVPGDRGGLRHLDALPFFSPREFRQESKNRQGKLQPARVSRHIGDSLLRQQCFQCHLDSPAPPGEFRSQGCAACHFTYSKEGLYRGKDPTLSRTEPGHPSFHRMTPLPPDSTCLKCHKAFNLTRPTVGKNGFPFPAFPGAGQIQPDVHFAKGLACIDCHTQFDIMGDGNLYSKQTQAVEIRCETCHGDGDSPPAVAPITDPEDRVIRLSRNYKGWVNSVDEKMALTARQQKMTNVKMEKDLIWTLGKLSGEKHATPVIHAARNAHVIPAHKRKLECTACHSQWVPRCNGCHASYDGTRMPSDHPSGTGGSWAPGYFAGNVNLPVLMVGPRGRVAPMLPQTGAALNVLDHKGKPVAVVRKNGDARGRYLDWSFTNPEGYSGSNLVYAVHPHSVGRKVRSCVSCHLSPRSLGLGEGELRLNPNPTGKNDRMDPLVRSDIVRHKSDFAPDAKVTLRGEPLAGSSQSGARPFNQEEIARILRVGNCIPCHDRYNDPIYRNIQKSYAFEKKLAHRRLRDKILKQK
ncbi:MAG: hypothetical protein ACE5E9_09330 [Nitrospinaceae bacterium]